MGDRTNATITIYACPPEDVEFVLDEVIDYYGFGWDYGELSTDSSDELALGHTYCENEISVGVVEEVVALMAEHPQIAYEVTEEPKYEWLGNVARYTPELGVWQQEADAEGQPVWGESDVRAFVAGTKDLDLEVGKRHRDALRSMDRRVVISDEHSNHNLPIGAIVTRCEPPAWAEGPIRHHWYTQGGDGDEVAIDSRDLDYITIPRASQED